MNATDLTTTEQDVIDAVQNGEDTTAELVETLDLSKGHVQKVLKGMVEDDHLDRYRDGPGYAYETLDAEDDAQGGTAQGGTVDAGGDGIMPVNRNYDWQDSDYHPDPSDYYSTDGELERFMAQIKHRHETNTPVRGKISGPTGCGKTTLAETLAAWNESREDVVFMSIQFSKDMSDGDLVGVPSIAGDSTMWVDGTLSKAFLAASEGKTVHLHLDEFNRAPPHVHNALFEALDHRGAVRLDGPRGGEVIQANPLDIIVTATVNEGMEYHGTEREDLAAKGRFTSKFEVDYLARYEDGDLVGVDDEAKMLVEDRGVPANVARKMVEAAADVRRDATDPNNTTIQFGIPTRAVLAWGGLAHGYSLDDLSNSIMTAAEDAVLENYYGDRGMEDAQDNVRNTLESHLDGAPFDDDKFEAWAADEQVVCGNCSWAVSKPEAENMGVMATMTCPECGDDRQLRTRSK